MAPLYFDVKAVLHKLHWCLRLHDAWFCKADRRNSWNCKHWYEGSIVKVLKCMRNGWTSVFPNTFFVCVYVELCGFLLQQVSLEPAEFRLVNSFCYAKGRYFFFFFHCVAFLWMHWTFSGTQNDVLPTEPFGFQPWKNWNPSPRKIRGAAWWQASNQGTNWVCITSVSEFVLSCLGIFVLHTGHGDMNRHLTLTLFLTQDISLSLIRGLVVYQM